jgi:hypothetical protein
MPEEIHLSGVSCHIDRYPNRCPICHVSIVPTRLHARTVNKPNKPFLEIVCECPNSECSNIFIAYFSRNAQLRIPESAVYKYKKSLPSEPLVRTLPEEIQKISPGFCSIYNEALKAEAYGLTQICGSGYRKALEFLIKDYLIQSHPEASEAIKKSQLGACINNYVNDPRTKQVAKRAAWLGNDETHYERKWIDKDLTDLKNLINLALYWIEADLLTADALASMPETLKEAG